MKSASDVSVVFADVPWYRSAYGISDTVNFRWPYL